MKIEYTLTVQEALDEMRKGKSVISNIWIGRFQLNFYESILRTNDVYFSCDEKYPCCHVNYPIDEFLNRHKDEKFRIEE